MPSRDRYDERYGEQGCWDIRDARSIHYRARLLVMKVHSARIDPLCYERLFVDVVQIAGRQKGAAVTTLTLDLPPELYERLRAEAEQAGTSPAIVAQTWLAERMPPPVTRSDRDAARQVLRAAGLLAELGLGMKARAARSTVTLEEVQAALDRTGGKPLSEIVLEMRGPKA